MAQLSVNLNKIALLRNARKGDFPSLEEFARICVDAGARGLTAHPRPDQRHIRISDLAPLKRLSEELGVELNLEGNPEEGPRADGADAPYPGFMALIERIRPDQCTLVPDAADQLTSDHGIDPLGQRQTLEPAIAQLKAWGLRASLFVDADPEAVTQAAALAPDRIELYTGPYAEACRRGDPRSALEGCVKAADAARRHGLGVNAGHDLNLENLGDLAAALPALLEVSIGHALTVDALRLGMRQAVESYLALLN